MSSAGLVRYYLDCPYEEKEHAKALGACWDRKSKKWYVPREKLPNLDDFNRWCPNGRFYLDCPFDERHEARSYGAQWDQDVGRWYVPATDYGNLEDFHRWLRVDPFQGFGAPYSAPRRVSGNHHPVYDSEDFDEMNDGYAYSDYLHQEDYPAGFTREASMRTASPPKKQKTKGSAADATTLRINDTMTVQQLQQECKHRGIKGFSGKNKDWLLDQLEVGSIWQFHRQEMAILKASKKAPAMKKKEDKGNTTGKNPAKNASHSVNAPSKSSKPKAKHDKSSFDSWCTVINDGANQLHAASRRSCPSKAGETSQCSKHKVGQAFARLCESSTRYFEIDSDSTFVRAHVSTKGCKGHVEQK